MASVHSRRDRCTARPHGGFATSLGLRPLRLRLGGPCVDPCAPCANTLPPRTLPPVWLNPASVCSVSAPVSALRRTNPTVPVLRGGVLKLVIALLVAIRLLTITLPRRVFELLLRDIVPRNSRSFLRRDLISYEMEMSMYRAACRQPPLTRPAARRRAACRRTCRKREGSCGGRRGSRGGCGWLRSSSFSGLGTVLGASPHIFLRFARVIPYVSKLCNPTGVCGIRRKPWCF